jgi:hypothetical protein
MNIFKFLEPSEIVPGVQALRGHKHPEAVYKAYASLAAMSTRLGFLKGHTQAVLCCEAHFDQSLLASGDEV